MKRICHKTSRITPTRPGFTFLEFLVAMVVLGIALTGLFPLMVVCSRGVESLELRYTEQGNKNNNWFSPVYRTDTAGAGVIPREDYGTWYMIPSSDSWARKLGAVATFSRVGSTASPPATIADDLDTTGYVTNPTSDWVDKTDTNAFRGHYQQHDSSSPATDTAMWTFSDVVPGRYVVLATWPQVSDPAAHAKYEVYDDNTSKATVNNVDQTTAPGDSSSVYQGRPWRSLTTQTFTTGTIRVKLSSNSNTEKAVVADAVRIVPAATILSVDKSFNAEEVTIRVKMGASP